MKINTIIAVIITLLSISSTFAAENEGSFSIDDALPKPRYKHTKLPSVYVCIFGNEHVLTGLKNEKAYWYKGGYGGIIKGPYSLYPNGKDIVNNKGQWVLPGGESKEGETLWQAAHREFSEETSYNINVFLNDPLVTIRGYRYRDKNKNYYALYIDVRNLADNDPRRDIGLSQPQPAAGSVIHNFNHLLLGKIACRNAINQPPHNFPQGGPLVDSDELESVKAHTINNMIQEFKDNNDHHFDRHWFRRILSERILTVYCDYDETFEHNGELWGVKKGQGKIRIAHYLRRIS